MTVRDLIGHLEQIADQHGNECRVFVIDGEGEWPFRVNAQPEFLGDPPRTVVYLDTTWAEIEPPTDEPPEAA